MMATSTESPCSERPSPPTSCWRLPEGDESAYLHLDDAVVAMVIEPAEAAGHRFRHALVREAVVEQTCPLGPAAERRDVAADSPSGHRPAGSRTSTSPPACRRAPYRTCFARWRSRALSAPTVTRSP